ncbi:formylglycine-generating enzyme family protein [uncultured Sphaerotilus sp.]|uniref:formylglycine-generating enzyme family protein n=1 Tax=uncultured Sphaerotilus sp. TaxID=474984 RepID=UPI0030CA1A97
MDLAKNISLNFKYLTYLKLLMEAELNRGQFSAFVRDNGYDIIKNGCHVWRGDKYELALDRNWKNPGYEQTDEHPVVCVSWIDAQAYAKWLSAKTGNYYRLLSESEWEYSARANSRKRTKFYFGDFDSDICNYANSADLSIRGKYLGWTFSDCVDGYLNTAPIKSFGSPNLFGLHDMLGNVWEWVEDCWHGDYVGAPKDGAVWRGSCEGDRRVIRGGGWGDTPKNIRSANRNGDSLNLRDDYTGFRLVREINFRSSSVPDSSGVGGDTGSATGGTL